MYEFSVYGTFCSVVILSVQIMLIAQPIGVACYLHWNHNGTQHDGDHNVQFSRYATVAALIQLTKLFEITQ